MDISKISLGNVAGTSYEIYLTGVFHNVFIFITNYIRSLMKKHILMQILYCIICCLYLFIVVVFVVSICTCSNVRINTCRVPDVHGLRL